MPRTVRLVVNGISHELPIERDRSLLSVVRGELGLTGAKPGCGEGECGACTVLVDGRPVRSCVTPVASVRGRAITTVEGLARDGTLHAVQQAFVEEAAMQCGFCTPGMVLGVAALLATDPHPDDASIRDSLEGNICRCGTYPRILRAARRAADAVPDDGGRPSDAGDAVAPELPAPRRGPWDLLAPEERDYFEVLSDGVVVVLPEEQATGGGWSTSSGAWIHVGADGSVTAFTGKVDVGQDNRTALSQLVAEELHVPLERIRLVMGDTDVCPFDMGTFGSRSMVDAGENLRATAASARELLRSMADDRPGVDVGELLRGARRVEHAGATGASPATGWRLAGSAARRSSAAAIATGAQRYPTDLSRPGMLHGRVLRPPAFGATLRSVDVGAARAIPGVGVVFDGDFVGVTAPDPATVARGLDGIRAEWDLLPQPNEGELIAHLRATQTAPTGSREWGGPFHHEAGDVDRALDVAAARLDRTYTTAYIAHVPLETRAALAEWHGGRVTVWTGTQRPFGVREELAAALDVAEADVRVIVPDTGGGYGGKHTGEAAVEAARLARASGRPVRVAWTRREEFTWAYFRPAAVIDVRSGATAGGEIAAWEFTTINAGDAGIMCPYEVPNQRIEFRPADSPLPQGSYRALAATANHFARESHLDELAHALGADPLELRLRHLRDDRLAAVLRAAADRIDLSRTPRDEGHGIGVAGGVEKDARVATCAEVRVDAGGRVEVIQIVTAFDCGAIVNPDGLTNQIEGATVMGLGGALFEAIHFDDGEILNPSLSAYRVPRFTDVPPIDVIVIDRPDVPSAGAGETPIVGVAPALANAIFDATGRRLRSLPLLPDGVLPPPD